MPGPHPDVAAARTAVRGALADLTAGSTVLVACSGGADSLALAAATAFVAPRMGLQAGSVTVDHGLRPGSRAEAERAARECRRLGLVPAQVVPVEVGTRGGPEAAAREARYAALRAAARDAEHPPVVVLLGHTMDDQAETVLLGLARGSGPRSLAGMAPRSEDPAAAQPGVGAVGYRRPFLGLRRGQTEQVCRALGLGFVTDPSNAAEGPWRAADGSALRRAALREHVLPLLSESLGPGVVPALARTAEQLRRDDDYLQAAAGALLAGAERAAEPTGTEGTGPTEKRVLDVATLADAHPAVRSRALHLAARRAGSPPGDLGTRHVAALESLVTGYHGQGPAQLPGGVDAVRSCGRLILGRRP